MEKRPVIPMPLSRKLREFRLQFLPMIVFASTLAAVLHFWQMSVRTPPLVGQLSGDVREIRAENAGILTNLFVQRFQRVLEGDVLAEIVSERNAAARRSQLRAPIAGVVTMVHHRAGETIPAGEPVLSIGAFNPEGSAADSVRPFSAALSGQLVSSTIGEPLESR